MNLETRRSLSLAAGYALALALCFPVRLGSLHFDVGIAFGWVAGLPLVLLLRGRSARHAFLWTWGASTVAFSAILWWVWVVVYVHGHAPGLVAVLAVGLLAGFVALHIAFGGWLYALLEPSAGALGWAVLPASWTVSEWLRSVSIAHGFPWAFLGYAAHLDGPLLQLASVGGVYGLSFVMMLSAVLLARGRWDAALVLFALAHGAGFALRLEARFDPAPAPLHAAVIQANIPQDQKWDPARASQAFSDHMVLSRLAARSGPLELIVWPEASAPVFLEREPGYMSQVQRLARETHATILVGGMGLESRPSQDPKDWRFFNSLFEVSADGALRDRYDKSVLVPFGEYVPYRRIFGFLSGIATGLATGDLTPGPGPRVLAFDGVPAHALAPLICYEVLYPAAVRRAVQRGARVLVNVTNDAWYGRSSAPEQFLAMAAFRSAENGVPMLRAANTGVSAIINSDGAVLERTQIFEPAAIRAEVPAARAGATLYTRFGDWVVWGCIGFLVAVGGRRIVGRLGTGERDAATDRSAGRESR